MYREYWCLRWLAIAAFIVLVAINPALAFACGAPPAPIYDGSSSTTTYETFWLGNTLETDLFAHSDRQLVVRAQAARALVGDAVAAKTATEIIAKNGTRIGGFTRHGIDRAIGDAASRAGTKPEAILDTLKNPTKIVEGIDKQVARSKSLRAKMLARL